MKCGSQIAVAVVGGYLLGRSHKTRLAALLALLAAGGRLPIDPGELLHRTPLGAPLDKLTGDLRGQLVDAGVSVAKKAASSRIDSLSDRLQQRADALREPRVRKGEEPEEPSEEPARPQRERGESARREQDREEPARRERTREPERDEYEDDDKYEDDEYEGDEYEGDELEREEPVRQARPESRRRAPRREDDRPRRVRATR